MADDNFLAEKEFDISIDGQTYKVKATAVFLVHGVEPQEVGIYLLDFTLEGNRTKPASLTRLIIRENKQDELPSSLFVREKSSHMRNARSKVGLILATEGLFVDL